MQNNIKTKAVIKQIQTEISNGLTTKVIICSVFGAEVMNEMVVMKCGLKYWTTFVRSKVILSSEIPMSAAYKKIYKSGFTINGI